MKYLFLIVFLIGCQDVYVKDHRIVEIKNLRTVPEAPENYGEFQPYVDSFIQDMEDRGAAIPYMDKVVSIEWVDELEGPTLAEAVTYTWDGKIMYITVELESWIKDQDPLYIQSVVSHELTHGACQLGHYNEGLHLMNPFAQSLETLQENWEELVDGLASYIRGDL